MQRLTALSAAILSALIMAGFAYAAWTEALLVEGTVETGELDWEIVHNSVTHKDHGLDWNCDEGFSNFRQVDKDVGSLSYSFVDSDGDGDYDKLEVTLSNVYPSYFEAVSFDVHNDGSVPLIIDKVLIDGNEFRKLPAYTKLDLNGDGTFDVEIDYMDNFGVQLDPCDSAEMSFRIHVLQGAPEGATLSFAIEIVAIQWNEYVPPP